MSDISAQQVIDILRDTGNRKVRINDCSMCGYPCGYIINADLSQVFYDSGCDCGSFGDSFRPSTFEDIADAHNMQTNPDAREMRLKQIKGESHA